MLYHIQRALKKARMSRARTVFVVTKDSAGEWRWSLYSVGNSKIIADSAEGYRRPSGCIKAAERVADLIQGDLAPVIKAEV